MKPVRAEGTNHTFRLMGGTEANDLPCRVDIEDSQRIISSVWELTDEERRSIASGANIELTVWGQRPPPVALMVTDEPLVR